MMLESVWFFVWGLLWAVFFITDGFDLGVGVLFPYLGKTEEEKRIIIRAVGPVWNGNEVWLLTAGGVTFAAFPLLYGVMFSSLYSALMLILFALILRGVSFEFRGKIETAGWRRIWDGCIFLGSFLPALLFGVAFANLFQGLPLDGDRTYLGNLFTLLNPYGLLGGLLFLLLFVIHGALWLTFKTEGKLQERAALAAGKLWPLGLFAAAAFLIASGYFTKLYDNFFDHSVLFVFIIGTVGAMLASRFFLAKKAYFRAWVSSALTILGATSFGIIGLYPNMFLSSIDPKFSLTAHNAASSPLTLKIMLTVVILFVPIVLAYQFWAYRLFKDKVRKEDLVAEEAY
ncbi:MAG: cytochrome d ubiquinol oxidase subunit II [Deltaproteobacteria bacterium HGW-Deltaproteobacteria-21]|nr:MAG: cytochrome d ubiquinol oxidase subunit II [Deltaproteobacteria bacterium HGW-Deltaproteobacteria-21]